MMFHTCRHGMLTHRDVLIDAGTQTPETDAVLTTLEVQQLLEQWGESLGQLPEEPLDSLMGQAQQHVTAFPGGSGEIRLESLYYFVQVDINGTMIQAGMIGELRCCPH